MVTVAVHRWRHPLDDDDGTLLILARPLAGIEHQGKCCNIYNFIGRLLVKEYNIQSRLFFSPVEIVDDARYNRWYGRVVEMRVCDAAPLQDRRLVQDIL